VASWAIGFILDGAGNLDILFNSALDGAYVESFSLGGSPVFATAFTCGPGFLAPLASGHSFIVMQSGACILPIGGGSNVALGGTDTEASFGAVVVDGDDDLFATTDGGMQSWDSLGNSRWTSELSGVVGGPLLGTGDALFVATTDSSMVPTFVALDTATGVIRWSHIASAPPLPDGYLAPLLTSAQELVFVSGNHAIAVFAGESPDPSAEWPTPSGGPSQTRAALGE
jgi:outer membrane protein assembly factor BamB